MKITAMFVAALTRLDPVPPPHDVEKRPVVLVHGIYSEGGDMTRLANHLRCEGRQVFTPTLSRANGNATIEELATELSSYVQHELPHGKKFDLVGFSMGGLVARYYVQRLHGVERVSHFVTMATPHHGTLTALVSSHPGCREMRWKSPFMVDLLRDADVLKQVHFTSFRTPLDSVILPSCSSIMPQAKNVMMWAWIHPSFLLEKRCLRAISRALGE